MPLSRRCWYRVIGIHPVKFTPVRAGNHSVQWLPQEDGTIRGICRYCASDGPLEGWQEVLRLDELRDPPDPPPPAEDPGSR